MRALKASMNVALLVALSAVSLDGAAQTVEPALGHRQLEISVRVVEAQMEPRGKVMVTQVLAEPKVVTIEGRAAVYRCGGEVPTADSTGKGLYITVPFGTRLEALPSLVQYDRVIVDVTLSLSSPGACSGELAQTQINDESTRIVAPMPLGETRKLPWDSPRGGRKRWIELTVKEHRYEPPLPESALPAPVAAE